MKKIQLRGRGTRPSGRKKIRPIGPGSGPSRVGVWIQEWLFVLACFAYLYLRIRPLLILEMQPVVFFKTSAFLVDSLKMPGGLTDWFSSLFSIFWINHWVGALFLSLCLLFIVRLTGKWIGSLLENRSVHSFQLIPAGFIVILMGLYNFRPSILLGLIVNLAVLLLFGRFAPKRQGIRAACGLAVSALLYWTTGGAFLTFTVLCGLEDLLLGKRAVSGGILLLVSGLLPYAAFASVFLVQLSHAYWHNTALENPGRTAFARYGLHGFYVLMAFIAFTMKFQAVRKWFQKMPPFPRILKLALGILIACGGTWLLSEKYADDTSRSALQLNRSMRESRWMDVLKTSRNLQILNPLFSYQTNQALFQSDLLLDKMFAFPQNLGTLGLLMDYDWCASWAEESGNFYWRLGLLSESMHWATEAYEHKGPTPDLLKRLGLIYMLKGANATAKRFFMNLRDVPFHAKSAEFLLRLNENPAELSRNAAYRHVRACMPVEDFISLGVPSSVELEQLVKRNPQNRMALEYQFAYYLLSGDLKKIWDHVGDFSAANYRRTPAHVQEALLLYAAVTPKFDANRLKKWVHPIVYNRFLEYERTLRKYGGTRGRAQQELQTRFSDTFWYYMMFVKSVSRRSENQNDFQ